MSKININQNEVFGTKHSRDYYRGRSFHFSGKWMNGVHYISDDYNVDFVVHDQVLLSCAKSHLSTSDNEPTEYLYDENGIICGVISKYWDFVLSGIRGNSSGIKIIDNYWYVCNNTNDAPQHQVWENTGVKAKMELSDLTPEEIAMLQEPGLNVVTEFVNNTITQTTGNYPDKIMSQKATTEAINTCATKTELSTAIATAKSIADATYQPKGDYATNTTVNAYKQDADAKNLAVNGRVDQTNQNLANEVTARQGDVSRIDNSISLINGDIETINGDLDTINGQIATIDSTLANKVDKVSGKQLSTEDYTTEEKTKLGGITAGAQPNVIEKIQINSVDQTITNKTVNLPAYPTTLPASDVYDWAKQATKPTYTKSEVGLSEVTNDAQVKRTEMGAANGVATLNADGKVSSSQLPAFVDDVLEYANLAAFPQEGENGKIYVALDTNRTYRWSGSTYTEISASIVIGTTTGTALDGKIGTDHINNTNNPHSVTKSQLGLGNVDNTSDLNKPISTATQTALNAKYEKPSSGIPKTDLASDVQTSLGKADTAIQDISGKADKVSGATSGDLAGLDSNGNLTDSNLRFESVAPSGYKRLEWLRSNAQPYIDTGLTYSDDLELEITFSNTKSAQYGHILGNYKSENDNCIRLLFSTNATTFLVSVNTKAAAGNTVVSNITLGEKHTFIIGHQRIVADGISYSVPTAQGTANNTRIAIFSRNTSGPALDVGTTIYEFIARRNGVEVLHLEPMLRISDSKPGMYDTLSGNFLVNIGSGEFTYGDAIEGFALKQNGALANVVTNIDNVTGLSAEIDRIDADIATKANIASPTFTGTPAAPTATSGTNTTQIATTAFVQDAISGKQATLVSGTNIKTVNGVNILGSGNAIVSYEETTWSALKTKRDGGTLTPGMWYRITDYNTTTLQADTQAAGHQFDVIVLATDVNKLSEEARAIKHSGDTYFTTNNANLEAWKIWYCLDNDTNRFAWADSTNGKGVIYRMIDEWNNDCPYDFKNIQFLRDTTWFNAHTGWSETVIGEVPYINMYFYTFSWFNDAGDVKDASIVGQTLPNDEAQYPGVYDNKFGNISSYNYIYPDSPEAFSICLGNNVFVSTYFFEDGSFNGIYGNTFGGDCFGNTFGNNCRFNIFGNNCRFNIFGNGCQSNDFGNGCNYNTFGNGCNSNTFGNSCGSNTFGNMCCYNIFGSSCDHNTFGNNGYNNTFENNDRYISFESNCCNNTFGGNCMNIRIQKEYVYNIIVENGNQKIDITSTQTTNTVKILRNFTIAQGVNNTSTVKTISHNTVNDAFKTTYQSSNSQIINV